jgi:hypothetical protein
MVKKDKEKKLKQKGTSSKADAAEERHQPRQRKSLIERPESPIGR